MKCHHPLLQWSLVLALAICSISLPWTAKAQNTWQRPFASNSIWNTPIGSGAIYVAANMGNLGLACNDRAWLYQTSSSDPLNDVVAYGGYYWPVGIYAPLTLTIPNEPNGCGAFLNPDGITIQEYNALQRSSTDPIFYGYYEGNLSLNGSGLGIGGHAGSGLSAIGGPIRQGELESGNLITHALEIELDGALLYRNTASTVNQQSTFRWPAVNSDGNWPGGTGNPPSYGGTNPALAQGSLCALPKSIDINALGLSAYGKIIANALQNYGGYVVDTTGNGWFANDGYTMGLCIEQGEATNYFSSDNSYYGSGQFYSDMEKIYPNLYVVNNNTPATIGGGNGSGGGISGKPNLVINGGFENDNNPNYATAYSPSGWSVWSDIGTTNASYAEAWGGGVGGGSAAGNYNCTHWSGSPYHVYTYQTITGLANGTYTLTAKMRSSGGQGVARIEAKNFNSYQTILSTPAPVTSNWTTTTVSNIKVTNGRCAIGFWSMASGNQWMQFDSVSFTHN